MKTKFPKLTDDQMRRMLEPPVGPVRLIIDTDTHNEIDDQFALAWTLLSQDVIKLEGILAEPYSFAHRQPSLLEAYEFMQANPTAEPPESLRSYAVWVKRLLDAGTDPKALKFVSPAEGMELSYQEILKVYALMEEDAEGQVFRGSDRYLTSLDEPIRSEATDHLIERALTNRDEPLYVAAIGCVTNIASAILLEPEIIKHIVVLWTSAYPSSVNLCNAPSLNLVQDKLASQLIFDSGVPHVYLPGYHIGAQLKISLPEMELWVKDKGPIGDYLHWLYTHNPIHRMRGTADHFGRTWIIWDIINIAWLLNPNWVPSQLVQSPILNDELFWEHDPNRHLMREAYDIDRDAIFRDFFTKLDQAYG